jgi:hypothetical protein
MIYREKISTAQQAAWFQRINNEENYFFLIHLNASPVGMIHLSRHRLQTAIRFFGYVYL